MTATEIWAVAAGIFTAAVILAIANVVFTHAVTHKYKKPKRVGNFIRCPVCNALRLPESMMDSERCCKYCYEGVIALRDGGDLDELFSEVLHEGELHRRIPRGW